MKNISLCCLILLSTNTSVASENADDWQKTTNEHVAFITKNCHQTIAYERYNLAKKIEHHYDIVQQKQNRLKSMKEAKENAQTDIDSLKAQIKRIKNNMLKSYTHYQQLGGTLALTKIKLLSDPCEERVREELSKLSYVAPITARYRHRINPSYPRREQSQNRTGRVEFEFVIDTQGKAKHIHTIASTSIGFKKSALKALQASTFYVYMRNGKAYERKAKTTFYFDFEPDTPDKPSS